MSRDGWLPPGVEYGDLPGNGPEDEAFDEFLDSEDCPPDVATVAYYEYFSLWLGIVDEEVTYADKREEAVRNWAEETNDRALERAFRRWVESKESE